jgi:MFS family permease
MRSAPSTITARARFGTRDASRLDSLDRISRAAARPAAVTHPAAVTRPGLVLVDRNPAGLRRKWAVLAVLLAAPFLAVLDGFIVTIAAPSIQDQLHASDACVQLVVAGYVVAYAAFLIAGGRLGDMHGRRRLLVVGLTLFSATSVLAAAAPDEYVLVVARFLQGVAAALMYPQTLALIRVHFHGRDLTSATAAFGVALGLASVTAQVAGGIIIQADLLGLQWRSIFLVNVPISAAAIVLARLLVPESRAASTVRLDVAGLALVTTALIALVLPLIIGRDQGWAPWTWWLLAGAVLVGALFTLHERRLAERAMAPLLSLDLFKVRAFVVGLLMTLVFYCGQISFFLLLSLYLQHGLGLTPLTTGLLFLPVALGFFAASVGLPRLSRRPSPRLLTTGALGLSACTTVLGVLAMEGGGRPDLRAMVPVLFLCGACYGVVIPTLLGVILRAVPPESEGGAAGMLVTTQQVAGAIGVALSGVIFFGLLHRADPFSYTGSFAVALGFNVVVFLATALMVQVLRDARWVYAAAG